MRSLETGKRISAGVNFGRAGIRFTDSCTHCIRPGRLEQVTIRQRVGAPERDVRTRAVRSPRC